MLPVHLVLRRLDRGLVVFGFNPFGRRDFLDPVEAIKPVVRHLHKPEFIDRSAAVSGLQNDEFRIWFHCILRQAKCDCPATVRISRTHNKAGGNSAELHQFEIHGRRGLREAPGACEAMPEARKGRARSAHVRHSSANRSRLRCGGRPAAEARTAVTNARLASVTVGAHGTGSLFPTDSLAGHHPTPCVDLKTSARELRARPRAQGSDGRQSRRDKERGRMSPTLLSSFLGRSFQFDGPKSCYLRRRRQGDLGQARRASEMSAYHPPCGH